MLALFSTSLQTLYNEEEITFFYKKNGWDFEKITHEEILEKSLIKRFWKNRSWEISETYPTICFENIFPTNCFGNITNEKILKKSFMKRFWKNHLWEILETFPTICFGTSLQQIVFEISQIHSQLLSCDQGLVKWKSGWVDSKHVSDTFPKN